MIHHLDVKYINWTQISEILLAFQIIHIWLNFESLYNVYRDAAFGLDFECIRKKHETVDGMPLTEREEAENAVHKAAYVSVEWLFWECYKHWKHTTR